MKGERKMAETSSDHFFVAVAKLHAPSISRFRRGVRHSECSRLIVKTESEEGERDEGERPEADMCRNNQDISRERSGFCELTGKGEASERVISSKTNELLERTIASEIL